LRPDQDRGRRNGDLSIAERHSCSPPSPFLPRRSKRAFYLIKLKVAAPSRQSIGFAARPCMQCTSLPRLIGLARLPRAG
jgi:hypothetical protein